MSKSEKAPRNQTINRESNTNDQEPKKWYKVGQNPCAIFNSYFRDKYSKYHKRKNSSDDSTHESSEGATEKCKKFVVWRRKLDFKCYTTIDLVHG